MRGPGKSGVGLRPAAETRRRHVSGTVGRTLERREMDKPDRVEVSSRKRPRCNLVKAKRERTSRVRRSGMGGRTASARRPMEVRGRLSSSLHGEVLSIPTSAPRKERHAPSGHSCQTWSFTSSTVSSVPNVHLLRLPESNSSSTSTGSPFTAGLPTSPADSAATGRSVPTGATSETGPVPSRSRMTGSASPAPVSSPTCDTAAVPSDTVTRE